jgi:tetratricopeptide (TPR) repeat protein
LLGSSALILQRNPAWRDDATLFLTDVGIQPRSIDLNRKAATVFLSGPRKDLDRALQFLEAAVQLRHDDYAAWRWIGEVHLERRDPQRAIESFTKMLTSRGLEHAGDARAIAHYGIGRAHVQRRDARGAVTALQRAVELQPAYREAWIQLCSIAPRVLDQAAIARLFERGSSLAPLVDDPDVAMVLAGMACQAGVKSAQAATLLEGALARQPESRRRAPSSFSGRLFLAVAYGQLGRVDDARRVYQQLVADPACPIREREHAQRALAAPRK